MFFTNLLREKRSSVWQNPPEIFTKMFGGELTLSGAQVNETKTLSLTAAWAAIMIIARTMGVFPLPIYRRLASGGKEKAPDHRLYKILHSAPNPYMTAFNWRFLMAAHQCLWGAGVSEIEFDAAGNPVALWPMPPWALRPAVTLSGEIFYEFTDAKGQIYNVPLFMLQSHEKSTSWGSGIAEIKDGFITFTMQPICTQWEYEINNKLLGDNDDYYCKFTMDGLLRGNIKDRMEAYKTAASLGIYDVNEMRELEDRNPLPDNIGKVRLVPMNMAPLEKIAAGEGKNEPVQKAV